MTMEYIDNYINRKIYQNPNFIKFTFFELRIKENLSAEETKNFLSLAKTRLENLNYYVYKTGQYYDYNGEKKFIEENELLVAVKK